MKRVLRRRTHVGGISVSTTTIATVLRCAGLGPAPRRIGPSWSEFLRAQAHSLVAGDLRSALADVRGAKTRCALKKSPICRLGTNFGTPHYDYPEVYELAAEFAFTAHIRSRGEEAKALAREAGYRTRRWVVERTHSWLNRYRALLIRWSKKPENHLAFLHLACALITWKAVTTIPQPE